MIEQPSLVEAWLKAKNNTIDSKNEDINLIF
jgi:hypothetical protein